MIAARHLAHATVSQFRKLTRAPLHLPDNQFARDYRAKGYAVLRNFLSIEAVSALRDAVAAEVYGTDETLLRHVSKQYDLHEFVDGYAGQRIIRNALLDPHCAAALPRFRAKFAEAALTNAIGDLLESIDGARNHVLLQTILFFVPAATATHVDGWGMDTEPCGYAHTLWMPLETVTVENGPVAVYDWHVGKRLPVNFASTSYEAYHEALAQELGEPTIPDLNQGDLVLFSSTTPHGTMPSVHPHISRMSMQIRMTPVGFGVGSWPGIFKRRPEHNRTHYKIGRWTVLTR